MLEKTEGVKKEWPIQTHHRHCEDTEYFIYILPVGLVVVADVVFTVSSTSGGEVVVVVFEVVVTVSEMVIAIIDKY